MERNDISVIGTSAYTEGVLHLRALFSAHCRYSKRLLLQHFIKGYGIYINLDSFTFLKLVDALVMLSKIFNIPGRA